MGTKGKKVGVVSAVVENRECRTRLYIRGILCPPPAIMSAVYSLIGLSTSCYAIKWIDGLNLILTLMCVFVQGTAGERGEKGPGGSSGSMVRDVNCGQVALKHV